VALELQFQLQDLAFAALNFAVRAASQRNSVNLLHNRVASLMRFLRHHVKIMRVWEGLPFGATGGRGRHVMTGWLIAVIRSVGQQRRPAADRRKIRE
jgi:hypothetical protein